MHFVRIIQAYQIWVQILIKFKSADIHVMYCNTRFNIKVKLHYWRHFRWYWRQESIKNLISNSEDIKFEFNGILFISRTDKSNLDRCYHGPEVMCPGRYALWNLSWRGPWYALWYLCIACSSPHLSDLSKLHLLVPIQIENDEYRMVCDQCSERASMMHCHLYQVSTCSVCAGIHLYNLSQQHIFWHFQIKTQSWILKTLK